MNSTRAEIKAFSETTVTRREALQGLAGVAAVAMLPLGAAAEKAQKSAAAGAWPSEAETKLIADRVKPLTEAWRFCRGDAQGAETGIRECARLVERPRALQFVPHRALGDACEDRGEAFPCLPQAIAGHRG